MLFRDFFSKRSLLEATESLNTLYSRLAEVPGKSFFTLVAKHKSGLREAHSFVLSPATRFKNACERAQEISWQADMYFNLATHIKAPMPPSRGGEDLAKGCYFAFLDLDTSADGAHRHDGLCPDLDAALKVLDNWLPPTLVVDSGNGIHVYWRFEDPFQLEDDPDKKAECKKLLKNVQLVFKNPDVNPENYRVDSTADLARYLRLPGTVSWKNPKEPRAVKIVVIDPEIEYSVEFLKEASGAMIPEKENVSFSLPSYLSPKGECTQAESQSYELRMKRAERWIGTRTPGVTRSSLGRNRYAYTTIFFLAGDPLHLCDIDVIRFAVPWGALCEPPFTEKEIREKLRDVRKNGATYLE